jgi:hypothetical protein
MAFEANVDYGSDMVIGTAEDGTVMHAGACDLLGIPWSHDKLGGPER